jgi:hypothetical protein
MRTTDFTETTENEDERKSKPLTYWVSPFEADSLSVTHLFSESYPCPSLKSVVVPSRIQIEKPSVFLMRNQSAGQGARNFTGKSGFDQREVDLKKRCHPMVELKPGAS